MRSPTTAKEWVLTVLGGIATTMFVFGLIAQVNHYASAEDTKELAKDNTEAIKANAEALKPVIELVEKLGNRAEVTDAKLERDAELCRSCVIKDDLICGPAGVKVCE